MTSRILRWTRGLLLENFWWKIGSLAIAVVLWAAVSSEPELSTFPLVTVEYRNWPDDVAFTADPVSTVKLELSGPSGELSGISGSSGVHPQVILDLGGIAPGRHTFIINENNVKLPRGVKLEGAVPPEIQLEFDRKITRTVPVTIRISGDGQNGYHVVSKSVDPAEVTIVGPAGRVERIGEATMDPIDVSSLVGFAKFQRNAYVQDPYVRLQSAPLVTVSIAMRR
jgi:YbbR domain-containing protein